MGPIATKRVYDLITVTMNYRTAITYSATGNVCPCSVSACTDHRKLVLCSGIANYLSPRTIGVHVSVYNSMMDAQMRTFYYQINVYCQSIKHETSF